jgi:anti-sigma regulatory factor (Ser/Thr protein kinase)
MHPLNILDWVIIAVSIFNTIILIWLGLTVLLNADRRRWGTWAAGGGFLLAGVFFVGHSAVVGRVIGTFSAEMELWWRLSWLLVVGAPYMWYLVMLSYTGLVEAGRHRAWLLAVTLLGAVAVALLALTNPLPTYEAIVERSPVKIFSLAGVPVLVLIYPVYSVLCFILSLSALRRPMASERFMGDLARRRARPWLMAASLVLLAVSLSIGAAAGWFLVSVQSRPPALFYLRMLPPLMGFDLLIDGMVAVAVVLTGQAIVSYEVFTGKALPRGGLLHYWRRSLVLAAGYGALIGATLSIPPLTDVDPIYRLLLATVLMTLFLALLIWRSYADRERGMDRLRPFVASERLYERLLRPAAPPAMDVVAPFRALCEDLLGARVAYLAALGPLAPLVGPGLAYPEEGPLSVVSRQSQPATDNGQWTMENTPVSHAPSLAALAELAAGFRSPQTMCVALDPARYGGAVWAVPLWSERGLIGVLLLGDKRDGGLYTQEEIEIARATGERLIDTQASAEMARRLMDLQRQRLAESQVIDRRTRRVLHDDVLPRLHAAMLMISAGEPKTTQRVPDREPTAENKEQSADDELRSTQYAVHNTQHEQVVALLADVHRQVANLLHAMPTTAAPEVARLGLIGALRQAVDGELGSAFDGVTWRIEPGAEDAAGEVPALNAEVAFYAAREAIRNAARYGRNGDLSRPLHLAVSVARRNPDAAKGGGLEIAIEDDGVGMGAATASAEGSGQGLGLHGTMMAVIGGVLTAESVPGAYTRVTLALPDA